MAAHLVDIPPTRPVVSVRPDLSVIAERRRDRRLGVVLLLPALGGLGLFVVWPLVENVRLSFFDRRLMTSTAPFEGLANWRAVLSDESFRTTLGFTVVYSAVTVTVSVGLALSLALALVDRPALRRAVGPLVLLPIATTLVVASIGWRFVFDLRGALNQALSVIGVERTNWLNTVATARFVVIFVGVWGMTGFALLLYQAALAKVPAEVFEAARVFDRWRGWRNKLALVVPLVSRTTIVAVVVSTILTLRAFDQIFALTTGGPEGRTENIAYLAWQRSFRFYDLGEGAAASAVLMLLVLVIAVVELTLLQRLARRGSYA